MQIDLAQACARIADVAQAGGVQPLADEIEHAFVQGHIAGAHHGGPSRAGTAGVEHLAEMPEKAEAAYIGARLRAHGDHCRGGGRVQGGRLLDGRHHVRFAQKTFLERARQHTDAQSLVSTSLSPGCAPAL